METIVKGTMLATALYLPSPTIQAGKVVDLDVYIDTPLLIGALGYHGDAQKSAARELLLLLTDLGAKLRCFAHTLQEVHNIFTTDSQLLRRPLAPHEYPFSNPVLDYALASGIGSSELARAAEDAERQLGRLGIAVRHAPNYTVELSIDETRLEQLLRETVRYQRDEARVYDVRSITAIVRIRHGRTPEVLERAKAIFVTSNGSLVTACNRFFGEGPNGFAVPVAARDWELGTIAWLKRPFSAPDLPRKQILADCVGAVRPTAELWRKYLEAIERLREDDELDEESYVVLRHSVEAKRALMNATLGSEDAFVIGSVPEILERAFGERQGESAAEKQKLQSELARQEEQRLAADHALSAAQAALEEERERSCEAVDAIQRRQWDRIDERSGRYARRITRGCFILLALVVVGGLALALPRPFPNLVEGGNRLVVVIAFVLIGIGVGISFLHVLAGWNARRIAEAVGEWSQRRIRTFLLRLTGLAKDDARKHEAGTDKVQ